MSTFAAHKGVPMNILSRDSGHWSPALHATEGNSLTRVLFNPGFFKTRPSLQVRREIFGQGSKERASGGIR